MPVPKSRRVSAATKKRREAKVIARVRAAVVERDGMCRAHRVGPCHGVLQWAHLGESKRFKTRGQAPDVRHTTAGTLMLCAKHHEDYDQCRLRIHALTAARANGTLVFEVTS